MLCRSNRFLVKLIKDLPSTKHYAVRQLSTRVQSKNLFTHLTPAGVLDPDAAKVDAALKKALEAAKARGEDHDLEHPPEVYAAYLRRWIHSYFTKLSLHPTYISAVAGCTHEELSVPVSEGEGGEVRVLVHTPSHLVGKKDSPAIIYAHGGAVIAGSAELYRAPCSLMALNCGMPVFNVDYRLAPQSKCPQQAQDLASVLRHISSNASDLGLNPSLLAVSGESGGAQVLFSTLLLLASQGEHDLVKLALPIVPMVSDYTFTTSPLSMTDEERASVHGMRASWKALAQDLEAQWDSPLLFPDKASSDQLAALPPTVIFTSEFDMFVTETDRLARRMRRAGSLRDLCCMPGIGHSHYFGPSMDCHTRFHAHFKLAVEEYLLK